jgi:Mrp family chromosome partitioning ATPase
VAPNDRISMASFCSIESFIATARKSYDIVLMQARPALLSHDALRLASAADIHLHLVHWRHTRRHPTLVAVQQFKRISALLSGIVIIEANLDQYRRYGAVDQFYYFGAGRERSPTPGKAREQRNEQS